MQVHKAGDDVRVYTRSLNDVTAAVPEIVEARAGAAGARADPRRRGDRARADGAPHAVPGHDAPLRPQARRRAHARASCRCAVFFFDCLHLRRRERSLDRPARERFAALADALPAALVIPRLVTADVARGRRRSTPTRSRAATKA